MSSFEAKKRDNFLTEAVYQEQIDFIPRSIRYSPKTESIIHDLNHDVTHRRHLSWSRTYESLETLLLRYSAGEDFAAVAQEADYLFSEIKRHREMFPDDLLLYWEPDAYQYWLWLLSLAVFMNKRSSLVLITNWYEHNPEGPDDPLIGLLLRKLAVPLFQNWDENLTFEKPYRALLNAVEAAEAGDKTSAQSHVKAYLKIWYQNMKNCYWHNRHKSKFAIHFGYWSLEAGLVTLLYDLDDASYREMLFYPKDMLLWAKETPLTMPSPALNRGTWIELRRLDDELVPIPHTPYEITFENGEVRTGVLDENGFARIENVPAGSVRVVYKDKFRFPSIKDGSPVRPQKRR